MNNISQINTQKIIADLSFFKGRSEHSLFSFNNYTKKLNVFWLKALVKYLLILFLGVSFSNLELEIDAASHFFLISMTFLLMGLLLINDFVNYIVNFYHYNYLKNHLDLVFSKNELSKIVNLLKEAAIDTNRLDDYHTFSFHIQQGKLYLSQIDFYVDMLEHLFTKTDNSDLNQINIPDNIQICLDKRLDKSTTTTINNGSNDSSQDLVFFDTPSRKQNFN